MGEPRKKRRWKPEEILAILRRVLLDRVDVSKACEETGSCPSQVCRWQKQLLDQAATVFERATDSADRRLKQLAAKADAFEEAMTRRASARAAAPAGSACVGEAALA